MFATLQRRYGSTWIAFIFFDAAESFFAKIAIPPARPRDGNPVPARPELVSEISERGREGERARMTD